MEDKREVKVKRNVHPITGDGGPEGEMYSSTLPSTSVLDGVGRREENGSAWKNHEAEEQQIHAANNRERGRERNGKKRCRKHKRSRITTAAHQTTVTDGLQVRTKHDW